MAVKAKVGAPSSTIFQSGNYFKSTEQKKGAPLQKASGQVKRSGNTINRATDPEAGLLDEIAIKGTDVAVLSKDYGLKREDLVRLTGFSLRALADWAAGKFPSQPAQRRLHEVRRLLDALAEVVHQTSIPAWLHRKNSGFEGMTPLQVIEVGEMDRLWSMVYDLGSSDPT